MTTSNGNSKAQRVKSIQEKITEKRAKVLTFMHDTLELIPACIYTYNFRNWCEKRLRIYDKALRKITAFNNEK